MLFVSLSQLTESETENNVSFVAGVNNNDEGIYYHHYKYMYDIV